MTTNTAPNLPRPAELLRGLLDSGYTDATAQVIRAISTGADREPLRTRLAQFDARAAELAAAGEQMSEDDPVLRALLADFGDQLRRDALLIDTAAPDLQSLGIDAAGQFFRQTTIPGLTDAMLAGFGIEWNSPDPEAINAAVQFTTSEAWAAELAKYQTGIESQVREIALRGIVSGRGPLDIAREVRGAIDSIPAYRANSTMRTLQLESYRTGAALHQDANRGILEVQIRIAALDARTCLCCISEHGKELPIGEKVVDHDQGRCTSITKLKGQVGDIIFQRYVNNEQVNFKTGEEWFNALPEDQQRAIAGPGALEALERGDVRLADFVQPYNSAIYGPMIRQSSLRNALNNPNRMVLTINGLVRADRGTPGNTLESLNAFVNGGDGPVATALKDFDMGLLELDFMTDAWTVNAQNVRDAAKRFVVESQDIQYGRDYLLSLVQQQAAENGVTLSLQQAAAVYNRQFAAQAQAIQSAALIGRVRLTEAQMRRLQTAIGGDYLSMVCTTESSTRGSLANAGRRTGNRLTGAELKAAREQFREYVMGIDDYIPRG